MVCQQCGLEYPDELTECPGCHIPNEETATTVMSEDERDSFEGITIDSTPDSDTYRVMDQDDLRDEKEQERPLSARILSFVLRHGWILWVLALLLLVGVAVIFLLPYMAFFLVVVLIISGVRALFL